MIVFKYKILNRLISFVLLHFFLILNISLTFGIEYADREIYSKDTLSPALQISNEFLKVIFNSDLQAFTPKAKNSSLNIYNNIDRNADIRVLATAEGYRIEIKAYSEQPLVLHWGVNNWQRPPDALLPQGENYKTYFHEEIRAMRTEIISRSEKEKVFIINVPQNLINEINIVDFIFFNPVTNSYLKNKDDKDYSVAIKNILENTTVTFPLGKQEKEDLLRLIKKRFEKDTWLLAKEPPLQYQIMGNIITQTVKTKDGLRVDVWVVANKRPHLYWGINGWQTPEDSLLPKETKKSEDSSAVDSPLSSLSSGGLYGISLHIPDTLASKIKDIDFNIFYPENGYWDNNQHGNYTIPLQGKEIVTGLLAQVKSLYGSAHKQKEARELLVNVLFALAERIEDSQLWEIFKASQTLNDLKQEDEDVLGLILIVKLLNEGAVWDDNQGKFLISGKKISSTIAELNAKLDPLAVRKTLYLFGLYDPSWISKLTHRLDYRQINQEVNNGRINDLPAFIQKIIAEYDDQEGAPQVLWAKSINETCLLIKLKFGEQSITTKWGYPTKKETYYYNGRIIELRDFWGNEFSRTGRKLLRYLDQKDLADIKKEIIDAYQQGKKVCVDQISWQSPETLTPDNYMYFHHKILEPGADIEHLLLSYFDSTTILDLPEGRKAWVFHRPESSDQLAPILKPGTAAADFWKNYWLDDLKLFIDEFDVCAFRVDLPGELQDYGNYSIIESVWFEAVAYAQSKGKKLYFVLETYKAYEDKWGWDEFSSLNNNPAITKYGYKPFRCYYKPIMENIASGNAAGLAGTFAWIIKDIQELIISLTNFDERRVHDLVPEEQRLQLYYELLYCFARAGFDVLVYLRDLGVGDIVTMCGGKWVQWAGEVKHVEHLPAFPRQFRQRLTQSAAELLEQSLLYQTLKNAPQDPLSMVFLRGNKVVFFRPGQIPQVFDLDQMSKPAPPVKVVHSEYDVTAWLNQYVYSLDKIKDNQGQALGKIEAVVAGFQDNGEAADALYQAINHDSNNFTFWDWEKNKNETLFLLPHQALAVDNSRPFLVDIKEKGQEKFRRIPALHMEKSGKYIALVLGLAPGKYTINFLWPEKHANGGWESEYGFEIEVLPEGLSAEAKAYAQISGAIPKYSYRYESWQPPQERERISRIKYHRDNLFVVQMPVSACRQKTGRNAGIGKWTDYAAACEKYYLATGANAFLDQPNYPVLNDEHSWYEPISKFALNEVNNDWDAVISEFFPDLKEKIFYLEQKGAIDFNNAEKRQAFLAELVFAEITRQGKASVLAKPLREFSEKFSWWLEDYCQFRAFYDLLGQRPWWEWPEQEMRQLREKPEFSQRKKFYAFNQFFALRQHLARKESLHSLGLTLIGDEPYYFAKNSVEVWVSFRDDLGYFFHPLEKSPGIKSVEPEPQIYQTLAAFRYKNLRDNAPNRRPYDLIIKSHEYKADVLGYDGIRIDAGHMAYPWTEEWLRSGDEPGDEFLLAIKRVYDQRNKPLVIVEQLGAWPETIQKIKDLGFITIEVLKYCNKTPSGNIEASLNTHDHSRVGEFYEDNSPRGYEKQFRNLFNIDARLVRLTAGEEYMDSNRINNPYLREKDERKEKNWRYLLVHPADPDYNKRVRIDFTSLVRSLAAEYLGDWDELFYQGMEQGEKMQINISAETFQLLNLRAKFTLRYASGGKEVLAEVSGPLKDIFKRIYTELAQNSNGENSLLHHESNGDFFTFVERMLEGIPGLRKDEAPEFWKEINLLKEKKLLEHQRISRNIRLLGLLTGLFEQIEKAVKQGNSEFSAELKQLTLPEYTQLKETFSGLLRSSNNFSYYDREIGWSNIAGEPHFHSLGDLRNWGRDTMISMFEYAAHGNPLFKDTIKNYMRFVKNGLLPNHVKDGNNPSYTCVDASMWMMYALGLYLRTSGDFAFLDETITMKFPYEGKTQLTVLEIMETVMSAYRNGTAKFQFDYMGHAAMDTKDKLIAAGNPGTYLTWKDGKAWDTDHPYTSRWGKPVEVNACWCYALSLMAEIYGQRKEKEKNSLYEGLAKQAKTGFKRFWDEEKQCLRDTLDGDPIEGRVIRDDQVWAIALGLFDDEPKKAKAAMDVVANQLLTVYGLRTRSPHDPGYKARRTREYLDPAYHQGIVWPWTMGGFIQAAIKVYGREKTIDILMKVGYFNGLAKQIKELKSIAEVFNGDCALEDKYNDTGCHSQSWSVRETLRGLSLLFPGIFNHILKEYRQEREKDPVWTFDEKIAWLAEGKSFKVRHFAPGVVHAGVMDFLTEKWSNIRDIPLVNKGDYWEAEIPGDVNVFTFKWPNGENEKLFYVIKREKIKDNKTKITSADLTLEDLLGSIAQEKVIINSEELILVAI
ncbi:MAG: 4-alpha-glucanotransferase [Candidatus Omnitrophica bacterium]|nr:4-alpha-glucanotransferase [Candidatus Omnitrophota bacterium]